MKGVIFVDENFLTYFKEEANYNKRNIYPIFIVLTKTDGPFAKATKFATGQEWSHATISFTPELQPYYTFGCRSLKPLKFGLMTTGEDAYYDTDLAAYIVYVMYVNKTQYTRVQNSLRDFLRRKEELDYSWVGIPRLLLKLPKDYGDKYFCSQFVMKLIGEAVHLEKDPSLWSPGDIESLGNISKVCTGEDLRKHDPSIIRRNLKFIQRKQFEKVKLDIIKDNVKNTEVLVKEEANYNKRNIYPVFIILTDADTPMAKVIKKATGQPWAHALISFNTKLDPALSFGCTSIKPLRFGFISSNEEDPFRETDTAKYIVYVMYINKTQLIKMKKRLKFFLDHKDVMGYSWKGLPRLFFNKPKEYENEWFCSQFVMKVIGEAIDIPKDPSLWTPGDIEQLKNISMVCSGPDLRNYDYRVLERNLKFIQRKQFEKVSLESTGIETGYNSDGSSFFTETTVDANKYFFRDNIGIRVDKVLSNPTNIRIFNKFVNDYVNRNIEKLTKSGPCDMIAFTDRDHKALFDIFGFDYEIDTRPRVTSPNEITTFIKEFSKEEHIKLTFFETNPSQVLLYFVIRYFTVHRDEKSLNTALSIYALCVYPLMFHKYFPNGVLEPFMKYTIDNLTDKFIIKKSKHLFGALVYSIGNSYKFHEKNFPKGNDAHMIAWVERIRNDQNSLFKKIANEYMKNWQEGKAARQTNEIYDGDAPIVDEVENATTVVQNIVQKVLLPIVESGVDILRAEAAAKMSQVSVSDCRFFLTLIITDKNVDNIQSLVESILFLYIYEDKRTERDIRSEYFLAWAKSLFKKTNSKNANINNINRILDLWSAESGIDKKFARPGSRINYKKAIFFYIILCIQKNM